MGMIPIVGHLTPDPSAQMRGDVERLAEALVDERPELRLADQFRALVPRHLVDGPALHLEDLSRIPQLDMGQDVRFYQDRARLRAGDKDLVATCADPVAGQECYFRDFLGLGSPQWLRPKRPQLPLRIAEACWEDVQVRRVLIDRLRRGELRYLHPNMGTFSTWELAFLLHDETRCPIEVISSPPAITQWANNKISFAATVSRLFGPVFVPRTESACNLAYIAKRVQDLAEQSEVLGLKLPSSGGGGGNLVASADQFRGKPLPAVHETLKNLLRAIAWDGSSELLIDSWETEVVCSPSAQVWVPPELDGLPVVEGIFVQATENVEGMFVGSAPAQFSSRLNQEITDRCWLLARLFQMLGYVGRCSFDMILVGTSLNDSRLEFVECNGRWGGTSLPMTLMNRVFGDWQRRPYAMRVAHDIPELDKVEFAELLEFFGDEVFDVRTGRGSLILTNPGRLRYQSGITAIVLGNSWDEANRNVLLIPERLRQFAHDKSNEVASGRPPRPAAQ